MCGIQVQQHLLAKSKLTFQEAFEIAQATEQNTKELQAGKMNSTLPLSATETVLAMGYQPPKCGKCYRCGGNHMASQLTYRCFHLAAAYTSNQPPAQRQDS